MLCGSLSWTHLVHYHQWSYWQSRQLQSHPSRILYRFLSSKIPHPHLIVQTVTWSINHPVLTIQTHSAGTMTTLEYFGLRTLSEAFEKVWRCLLGLEPALTKAGPPSTWIHHSGVLTRCFVWMYLPGVLFECLHWVCCLDILTRYVIQRLISNADWLHVQPNHMYKVCVFD